MQGDRSHDVGPGSGGLRVIEARGSPHREMMVAALARYLIKNWMVNVVRMARRGGRSPRGVNGSVPDLEAITPLLGQRVFGAAEECDTYAMKDSRARLDAFSKVRNAAVFLVVPAECYVQAAAYVRSSLPGRNITVLPYDREEVRVRVTG